MERDNTRKNCLKFHIKKGQYLDICKQKGRTWRAGACLSVWLLCSTAGKMAVLPFDFLSEGFEGRFHPFCLSQGVHTLKSAGAVRSSTPFCHVPKNIYFFKRAFIFPVQMLSKFCT